MKIAPISRLLIPGQGTAAGRRGKAITSMFGLAPTTAEERTPSLIDRAKEAQERRDWSEAERLWRQVVDNAPGETGAWIQLGNMLNELERRAEAIEAFRHAGQLDPGLAHAPAGVAGVLEREDRWDEAGEAWLDAIDLLVRDPARDGGEELAHAFAHVAMSARNSGDSTSARHLLNRAMAKCPDLMSRPDSMSIRAKLLPQGRSATTAAFLRDFVQMLPVCDHAEASAKPEVRGGDLFPALLSLAPYLERGKASAGFLTVAIDLYENARLWREAARIAEWQAALEPVNAEHVARAFRAASAGRRLSDARRLASRHARTTGELILIHQLAVLYDDSRQPHRARLLLRFLKRRWPHSRWHSCRYILATAATRSLAEADRLVRLELADGRRDHELERVYCQSAFAARHYEEARLRLSHWLKHHDDHDAETLLGYAIANSRGIDEAAAHFRELAAKDMQSLGAMMGIAHMAMRKRDLPLALEHWAHVAIVHNGAANANVERARCAYGLGDIAGAMRICREHLRLHDTDLGTIEYYAWLLTMGGHYEAALTAIMAVLVNSGPNWQAADLQVICSSQLGTLDEDWDKIVAMLPASDSSEAASRIYHLIRILVAVGRRDLADRIMLRSEVPVESLPWAAPYLRAAAPRSAQTATADRRWRLAASTTRSDISERLDTLSDADVDALLDGGSTLPTVHIINKFEQPRGGSELHALDLAAQIGRYAKTRIWAPEMPHPEFSARHGVSHIDPTTGVFPRGGVLVLIGVYFDIVHWISHVQPTRIIILYNTFEAPSLFARIEEAYQRTGVRPELLYCSDLMGRETGLTGRFEPSPTDLEEFSPSLLPPMASRPFTLGRHSRDVPEKHGRDDWKVYQQVSELGGDSVLLGGTCMAGAFPPLRGMQLLRARNSGIPAFLHGIDAYFYRTSTWIEPWGRVVIEAMACGLPVLVHSPGGYAQAVEHEVSGLVFDTTEEAVRLVRRLIEEPGLRARLGAQARRSACALLAPAALKRMIAFYLLNEDVGFA